MRKVVFAKVFKASVPTSNNDFAIYDPRGGAYIAVNHSGGAANTYPELDLLYMRDSKVYNVPIFPLGMTYSYGAWTASAAPIATVTPTTGTLTAGETYTMVLSVAGHPNDNRYTKRASIIATDDSANGSNTMTLAAAIDAFVVAIGALGNTSGAAIGDIMGVTFTAANSTDTALTITNATTSKNDQIVVSFADSMVDHGGTIAYSGFTGGLDETSIKLLESDADTELNQRGLVTSGFNTVIDGLATGYHSDCLDLCVLKYKKPADQVLATENNLEQELYLFYDTDYVFTGSVASVEIIKWLCGVDATIA